MIKTLMGTAVGAAVLFGAMMAEPAPAHAIYCSNCGTEWTQLLNWALLGKQLTEDQAQTVEMLRQGVELYNQGEQMKRMLERGTPNSLSGAAASINNLMGVQSSAGGKTIYWDNAPGAVSTQKEIFPDALPRDAETIDAYKELQHQHVKESSLNAKAVTVQAMTDIADMRQREAELEDEAALCPGQTCVLDIQRQREILAQEMAQRQAIMQASQAEAQRAVENYNLAAKERAEANRDIDMAGMPGYKPKSAPGVLSAQGRSTTGTVSRTPGILGVSQ